jgi:hypothetical protein
MAHGYRIHPIDVMEAWKMRQAPEDFVSWNTLYEEELAAAWEESRQEYAAQLKEREHQNKVAGRRAAMVLRAHNKKVVITNLGNSMIFGPDRELGLCPGGIAARMTFGFAIVDANEGDPLVEIQESNREDNEQESQDP